MFTKLTASFLLMMQCHQAAAQLPAADTSLKPRSDEMIAYYHGLLAESAFLYTGRAYFDYPPLEGHAYLDDPNWFPGAVTYDSLEYNNIFLKYDLVKNLVVVQRPDRLTKVSLQNRLVSRFTIGNKKFVQLQAVDERSDSLTGFYELMAMGQITLLGKKEKKVEDVIRNMDMVRVVSEKSSYHVYRNGKYFPVPNLSSFYQLVPGQRKELQQYLRKQKINYRRNPGAALTALVRYYNQTTP